MRSYAGNCSRFRKNKCTYVRSTTSLVTWSNKTKQIMMRRPLAAVIYTLQTEKRRHPQQNKIHKLIVLYHTQLAMQQRHGYKTNHGAHRIDAAHTARRRYVGPQARHDSRRPHHPTVTIIPTRRISAEHQEERIRFHRRQHQPRVAPQVHRPSYQHYLALRLILR